ncbi:BolA family protein [Kordiimonas aquimaris]|uniref:BolA family protein n=1 Tax=Kordiimonas aquimaris TaxID=707591 RepID=UPI0021CF1B14|nr:BolA family protein [Kordiimonas aquimaris]
MGEVSKLIEKKLKAALKPTHIEVIDDSASHAGHMGNPNGDRESHFHLNIVSSAFEGKSRLARQRLVNAPLRDELKEQIHALSMKCMTPSEIA